MTHPPRRSSRARWSAGALAVVGTIVLLLTARAAVNQTPAPAARDAGTRATMTIGSARETPTATSATATAPDLSAANTHVPRTNLPRAPESELTVADGYIPDGEGLSPFDINAPAISNLTPGLLEAIQNAATDASAEGIEMVINNGWRSERYQQTLLNEAIVTYGSEEEARKWVNTPDRSTHVTGEAVDVGPTDADSWLSQHGADYGLCQTYANEIWHFELAVEPGGVCPEPISDASAG